MSRVNIFSRHTWISLLDFRGELIGDLAMSALAESAIRKNFDYFQGIVRSWMPNHAGQFALLRDGGLVDFFDVPGEAIKSAVEKFEDGQFSIQRVIDHPVDLGFLSYASGDRAAT
jgi:hypothetical protein